MKCISALKAISRVPTALVWPLRTRVIPAQAAANGHTECVRLLVEAGADVEARDDKGRTPLDTLGVAGSEWFCAEAAAVVRRKLGLPFVSLVVS